MPGFLADAALNVAAILLAITLYSSISVPFNVMLLSTSAFLNLLPSMTGQHKKLSKPPASNQAKASNSDTLDPLPLRPFVTAYRGGMIIVTCLAILAVDFKIFPRRFAKVETWGTSLMDMGVGSFVFSAGLISARPVIQAQMTGKSSSIIVALRASLRASLPLLVLGIIRLYSVKGLDYAEHVTEYGVHWNFFFTLAFLPPFGALCQVLPTAFRCYVLPSFVSLVYQAFLEGTSLQAYILTAPRVGYISQNREGIFSFWGYFVIFLTGQAIGLDVFPRDPETGNPNDSPYRKRVDLIKRLGYWWASSFAQYVFSTNHQSGCAIGLDIQPSRRLANLPYAEWVIWFNCAQLLAYCLTESLLFPGVYGATDRSSERRQIDRATSRVLRAFNHNGLAIFLLANLLTGLVNLTTDTLAMTRWSAMAVLGLYAGLVTAVAVELDQRNISIKM